MVPYFTQNCYVLPTLKEFVEVDKTCSCFGGQDAFQFSLMNLPNLLTLSRIAFLFVVVALLLMSWTGAATLGFVLFIVASVTDWLDGYIARRCGLISNFGKLMDALADKILVVGMFVVLLAVDIVPAWTVVLVLIILGREFLVTGLRLVAAAKGQVLAAEKSGKLKTVVQIVCVSVFLFVYALQEDLPVWGWYPGVAIEEFFYMTGMGLFFAATILTITSGAGYIIRYADLLKEEDTP